MGFIIVLYVVFILCVKVVVKFLVFNVVILGICFEKFWNNWDKIILEFLWVFINNFLDNVFVNFFIFLEWELVIVFVLLVIDKFIFVFVLLLGIGKMFNELIYFVFVCRWVVFVWIIFWNWFVLIFVIFI